MAFISLIPASTQSKFISPNTTKITSLQQLQKNTFQTCQMSINDSANYSKRFQTALVAGACAFLVACPQANAAIFHFNGTPPSDIGVQYGRYLQNCPTTDNCISSSANVYDKHYVPSWTYNNEEAKKPKKSMKEAVDDIVNLLRENPSATIVQNKPMVTDFGEGHYIYVEFESKLMGFIDDVEFYFRPDESNVEYRSASRLGEGDFGANRTRIRDIRKGLQELDSRWASTGY